MYSKIKYCSLIWNFKDKQDNCGAELIIAGQFTFHKLRSQQWARKNGLSFKLLTNQFWLIYFGLQIKSWKPWLDLEINQDNYQPTSLILSGYFVRKSEKLSSAINWIVNVRSCGPYGLEILALSRPLNLSIPRARH